MRGDHQWHKTELAACEANGRGDRELAVQLMAQSVTEARDPSLPWHELQSALAGSALFHAHVTFDFALAIDHYRESYEILSSNLGPAARESMSFAECMAECAAKFADSSN